MATKKITITDQPEEAEETTSVPENEAAVDESTPEADSSADTSDEQHEADQPTEDAAPESPEQTPEPSQEPSQQGSSVSTFNPKKVKVGRRALIAGVVVIVVVAGGLYFLNSKYNDPLPTTVTKQVGFKVYYPQSSDNEYKLAPQSASYADGKLSYSVTLPSHSEGASPFIRVSETALVGKGPDVTQLPNFKVFDAPAGKAAVSPNGQVLNGVLVTNKTLVILNGLGGVTQQDLMQFIKSM